MPALHEPMNLGDLLKYEGPHLFSREALTVAAGQNLTLGTVLGLASDGTYHALNPTADTGIEVAAAVLLVDCDATVAPRTDAIAVRRHAIVARNALVWPADITAPQKATAEAELESRGILVRDSA